MTVEAMQVDTGMVLMLASVHFAGEMPSTLQTDLLQSAKRVHLPDIKSTGLRFCRWIPYTITT